jgi:hypothetical protein
LGRKGAKSQSLVVDPFLERLDIDADAVEQVALVEVEGATKIRLGACLGKRQKLPRVDPDHRGIEGKGIAVTAHRVGTCVREFPSQSQQALAKSLSGLPVVAVAP